MSLRGDNGGLQRNRWPDRAPARRYTYDLRLNNLSPVHGGSRQCALTTSSRNTYRDMHT